MTRHFHAVFALFATLLVAFAIGWGFMLVGSPNTRRLERFDEQRLQDLKAIVREINARVVEDAKTHQLKGPLPKTLQDAVDSVRNERLQIVDPETGQPYGYVVKSETVFELCATFTGADDSDRGVFWNHPAGTHCFTIDLLDPPPFY